jgi:hypothetical protein
VATLMLRHPDAVEGGATAQPSAGHLCPAFASDVSFSKRAKNR